MLLLSLLVGCPSPEPAPDPEPFVPTLETGGCGLEPYDWAAMDRMGEIVDWEYQPDASFSADAISGLIGPLGLEEFTPVPHGVDVYRIRYLTQDRGQPIEATALLAFPTLDEPATVPTLLWVRPTVGFSDDCAPSGGTPLEQLAHVLTASFGYAVVAPDLLGMNGWGEPAPFLHPYVVPEPTAVASLDGIRALWSFAESEGVRARPEPRALFIGASEGGFGALWADRYASGYLPEVHVEAVVAAVPPTDMRGLARGAVADYRDTTGGLVAVLATSNLWYGEPGDLDQLLTDQEPGHIASTVIEALATQCSGGGNPLDGTSTVQEVYRQDFIDAVLADDWASAEPWACMLERAQLSESVIPRGSGAPVLYQVSENDELVVGATGRADAPRLCEAGYELEYLECAGADHVSGAADSLPYQLRWAFDRMAGEPIVPCELGEPVVCSEL